MLTLPRLHRSQEHSQLHILVVIHHLSFIVTTTTTPVLGQCLIHAIGKGGVKEGGKSVVDTLGPDGGAGQGLHRILPLGLGTVPGTVLSYQSL